MTRSNERYMPAANRRRVSDIDALRTLAHPVHVSFTAVRHPLV
jgi:hypothetical protein